MVLWLLLSCLQRALAPYDYPIGRAALAHAVPSTRGPCTATWQRSSCSSYAQSHEDLALYEQFFADKTDAGFFVEMGALDGVTLSNTLAFERSKFTWKGILIEANPALCEGLRAHRGAVSTTLCSGVSDDFSTVYFQRGLVKGWNRWMDFLDEVLIR